MIVKGGGRQASRPGLVLALLLLAYTFNCIDRTIVTVVGQAIKVQLLLTDTQVGLIGGIFFALLYTVLGIPIARLAERFNRVNIITVAIVIWSGFTMLCGAATGFTSLALYRLGVGIGEAGLSPPALSLISDYFGPKRRATAFSTYSLALPIATIVASVVGGYLVQHASWRIAFVAAGLPGFAIALLLFLLVREPKRGSADSQAREAGASDGVLPLVGAPAGSAWRSEISELVDVFRVLLRDAVTRNLIIGITLISFAIYGRSQFVQPFFIRAFGLNYAQVGLLVGLVAGLAQAAGTLAGGYLTDRLGPRGQHWYATVPAVALACSVPCAFLQYLAPTWQGAAPWLGMCGFFAFFYFGPTFAVIQNSLPAHRRATGTAIVLLVLNLIGLGGGPALTGWAIDRLSGLQFLVPGRSFWDSLSQIFTGDAGQFLHLCPGGKAIPAGGAALATHCRVALDIGTREGLAASYMSALAAALFYLLAARALRARVHRA